MPALDAGAGLGAVAMVVVMGAGMAQLDVEAEYAKVVVMQEMQRLMIRRRMRDGGI